MQVLSQGSLDPTTVSPLHLRLPFIEGTVDPASIEAGVGVFLLPETAAAKPGFSLLPFASGSFETEIALNDLLTLGLKTGIDLTGGVGINLRPGQDIQFFAGLLSGTASAVSGNVAALLKLGRNGEPLIVVGGKDQSRL